MSRGFKITLALFLGFFLFGTCLGPGVFIVPLMLASGWIPAATRLYRAWHPGMSTVGWVVMAVVLVIGTQVFLGWLYRSVNARSAQTSRKRWRLRWTLGGFAALFCVFVALTSVILITHQVYWMAKGRDPLFANRAPGKLAWWYDARQLHELADRVEWDSAKTRAAFFGGTLGRRPGMYAESVQAVWVEGESNTLRAVVLVPRHPLVRQSARIFVLKPNAKMEILTLDQLPDALASLGIGGSFSGGSRTGGLLP